MQIRTALARGALLAALFTTPAAPGAAAGEQQPLGNKWRITSANIEGTHSASYGDADRVLTLDGTASYQSVARGKAFTLRLSNKKPVVVQVPVKIARRSETALRSLNPPYPRWDCSYAETYRGNLVGVVWVSPNGVRVQWTLVPAGFDCPQDASDTAVPQFASAPAKSYTQRFPVKRFIKKTATIPVRIKWEGSIDGWIQEIAWKGTVTFSR